MSVSQRLIERARAAKHAGFVASKPVVQGVKAVRWRVLTLVGRAADRYAEPYTFDPARYRRSFLARSAPPVSGDRTLPARVFVLWVGDNELTPNRSRSLDALRAELDIEVQLVTPANLGDWIVDGHPLHRAYGDLSLVHRSDYLRAYLMHHHGGGYADMKRPLSSWRRTFDDFAADNEAWVVSYPCDRAEWASKASGRLGKDLLKYHQRLLGNGAMIVRPHTPFTAEWLREVERRLDYYADQAREFPGGVRGEVVGYPISWNRILANVFNPLLLKYLEHVRQDSRLLLDFVEYK